MEMPFPPQVEVELEGWLLFWAELELRPGGGSGLDALRAEAAASARTGYSLERLGEDATVSAVRRLFRQAGCDPTRYRPASEALLRRILKGEEIPAIHPFVDTGNCLSAELAVPVCVADASRFDPPLVWRAGRPGETMLSLKGPFDVAGKPLLLDREGPVDVPITGSQRVKVTGATSRAWLVAYLPAGVVDPSRARDALRALTAAAPATTVRAVGATPSA
jgi:DNA/RNA-binding domain of Phe-tRNA-synthetase-like protein